MDMKKILQAMDGVATKPVEGSDSMARFLRVVKEAELNQPDPKYVEYAQLMAKYDMLAKEMAPELGVEKGASPDAIASINAIKAKAEQLAGSNLQAWEQARQQENSSLMAQANANHPALAAQLENAPAAQQSPEQIAYNQLRAQLDSTDALRGGANTFTDVSPEVTAKTTAMRTKLAQMAAALKAKGIDAEAEYDAPDPSAPVAAPVDLAKKYVDENTGMSRFLSIMNEGASPHRVALPVQMAMNHYQKPQASVVRKDRLIDKYFTEAEAAITQRKEEKRAKINQYASVIAERVLMKESMAGVGLQPIDELSTELLGKYKKAAGADAKKADAEGNFERGNKRFKGINKATIKQFDNDAKKYEGYDGPNDAAQFAKPPPVPQVPPEDGIYGSWEFTTRKDGDRSATGPAGTFVWDNSGAGGALRLITWSLPSNIIPGMSWVTDFVSGTHTLENTFRDLELNTKIQTKLDGTNPSVSIRGSGHEAKIAIANGKATGTYKDPDGKETSWDIPPEPTGEVKQEGLDQLLALRNKIDEAIKQRLDPKCWKGKHKEGTKIKGGVRVNNCVPNKK